MFVLSETFIFGIIVHGESFACPALVALNAKVVICLFCQPAVPASRFQYALCKGNGSRNFIFLHFLHGNIFVGFNIFPGRYSLLRKQLKRQKKDGYKKIDFLFQSLNVLGTKVIS